MVDWKELCKGCGKCCGPVLFPNGFIHWNKDKIQARFKAIHTTNATIPLANDVMCIFLDRETKRCLVYDERPEICRLQGTVRGLPCPKLDSVGGYVNE